MNRPVEVVDDDAVVAAGGGAGYERTGRQENLRYELGPAGMLRTGRAGRSCGGTRCRAAPGRCRQGRRGVVCGTRDRKVGQVREVQRHQDLTGRTHQHLGRAPRLRGATAAAPSGDGHQYLAHRTQGGLRGVQEAVGDGADLGGRLGCGEGVEVGGDVRCGQRLLGERVVGKEGFRIPRRPPQQVAAGGDAVARGGDLVGVAADVVVQLEVGISQGYSSRRTFSEGGLGM